MEEKNIKKSLWIAGILTGLYGSLNQLLPAISSGNITSIIFIIISGVFLTTALIGIAKNPMQTESSYFKEKTVQPKYSKRLVLMSKIGIVLVSLAIVYGVYLNFNKIKQRELDISKEGIHFLTEGIAIVDTELRIDFNVINNTSEKIHITSFEILEYHEEHTCSYNYDGPLKRYGLDLTENVSNLGETFIVDSKEILGFKALIDYEVYLCVFKAFGIIFRFNEIDADQLQVKSDAIYFIDGDDRRFEFLKPGRFELLLDSNNPKSFTYDYRDPYPKEYFELAQKIYEEHKN